MRPGGSLHDALLLLEETAGVPSDALVRLVCRSACVSKIYEYTRLATGEFEAAVEPYIFANPLAPVEGAILAGDWPSEGRDDE